MENNKRNVQENGDVAGNRANFLKRALLSRCEVIYAIDEWLRQAEARELEMPLSDDGVDALLESLKRLRGRAISAGLKTLRIEDNEPLRTYALDIFEDCIQLGVVTYGEGSQFDESGMPITCDDSYELLLRVPVRTLPVDKWAEANGVKPGTVRQWISRKRIPSCKDERGVCISAIQYLPDAIYERPKPLRYKMPGTLPESVTEKYAFLAGDLLDILMLPPENGVSRTVLIRIASDASGGEETTDENGDTVRKASVQTLYLGEDVRADIIRRLGDAGYRSQSEKYFVSPLKEAGSGGRHFAKLMLSGDEIRACRKQSVSGEIRGEHVFHGEAPAFTLTLNGSDDSASCVLRGGLYRKQYQSAEERLLQALFGHSDLLEAKARLKEREGVNFDRSYPWDSRMMFVHDITLAEDVSDEDAALFLKTAMLSAAYAFAFEAGLAVFTLDVTERDEAYRGRITRLMAAAGYREVRDAAETEDGEEDIRVFYAYAET